MDIHCLYQNLNASFLVILLIAENGDSDSSPSESRGQPEGSITAMRSERHGLPVPLHHGVEKMNGDSRKNPTRSRSHSQDTYRRFSRNSDECNYVNCIGHHTEPPIFAFSSNHNKIKLKTYRHDNTDSETVPRESSTTLSDINNSLHESKEYRSVKYDRKIRNSEENAIDYPAYNNMVKSQFHSDDRVCIQNENASDVVEEVDQVYGFHRKHVKSMIFHSDT